MIDIYKKFRAVLCELFGWHKPGNIIYYDGEVKTSTCKYCGKKITCVSCIEEVWK